MRAKSYVFSYFKKSNANILLEAYFQQE